MAQADLDNIQWNLQTWPLELVEWPVNNSQRLDVQFLGADRFGDVGDDSVWRGVTKGGFLLAWPGRLTERGCCRVQVGVLPANERCQVSFL